MHNFFQKLFGGTNTQTAIQETRGSRKNPEVAIVWFLYGVTKRINGKP
jgi:hypothetical protein